MARPFSKGLLAGDYLTWAFIPLRRIVPLRGTTILSLWRGPSPRAYSQGIISHGLSYRCDELCLFEALYPAPLARPFSKGLLAGIISHRLSCRCDELCLFEALHPAPLARPFSKGLLAGIISHRLSCRCDELCLFEALQSSPFGAALLQGPMRGSNAIKLSGRSSLAPHRGSCPKG